MSKKSLLARLEDGLRSLVEGGAGRIFPAADLTQTLQGLLEQALAQGVQADESGRLQAPNFFTVLLPPAQHQALGSDPALAEALLAQAAQAAARLGAAFTAPPVVKLLPHPQGEAGQPQVLARLEPEALADTTALEVEPAEAGDAPAGAYLVVNGLQIVPLRAAALTLGRDPGCGLVVEDQRVSRTHAQLRLAHGRYVIFDLDSTGGTFVNGRPVSRHELLPGDVISLAGVPLVYGEEAPQAAGPTQEIPAEA